VAGLKEKENRVRKKMRVYRTFFTSRRKIKLISLVYYSWLTTEFIPIGDSYYSTTSPAADTSPQGEITRLFFVNDVATTAVGCALDNLLSSISKLVSQPSESEDHNSESLTTVVLVI
jgi:hypothetical protein